MAYKDKAQQREYQQGWIRDRRASFFSGKACVVCGSVHDLELHHRDPDQKEDHRIWSWTEARRLAELAKCVVMCRNCHRAHHAGQQRGMVHGTVHAYWKGCRCESCRAANAAYKRQQVHRAQSRYQFTGD